VIFLDTSALYALAVKDDLNHKAARSRLARALDSGETLVIHNLILVETVALLQRRQGHDTARQLVRESRYFRTIVIDEDLHRQTLQQFVRASKPGISLVDLFSFAVMRREGIHSALAFDRHFEDEGFELYGPA